MHPGVYGCDIDRPACLEKHSAPGVRQPAHERKHLWLEQRLAPRYFNQPVTERERPLQNPVDRQGLSLGEGMRRVAIPAPEVAGREPDKHAW